MGINEVIEEEWRPIPGWEDLYSASSLGRIRKTTTGKVLKPRVQGGRCREYHTIGLWRNKKQKRYSVSRLVLAAFTGCFPKGLECNHLNGNKADNSIVNLEWTTRSGNIRHAYAMGLAVPPITRGELSGTSKLTECDVHEIRARLARGESERSIAPRFGVSHSPIGYIKRGECWGWLESTPDQLAAALLKCINKAEVVKEAPDA